MTNGKSCTLKTTAEKLLMNNYYLRDLSIERRYPVYSLAIMQHPTPLPPFHTIFGEIENRGGGLLISDAYFRLGRVKIRSTPQC